jgi:hypothetical protein
MAHRESLSTVPHRDYFARTLSDAVDDGHDPYVRGAAFVQVSLRQASRLRAVSPTRARVNAENAMAMAAMMAHRGM